MAQPKEIEICPIVDSVVELRFSSKLFANAVFGVAYNNLKSSYPTVEKLPILQLPEPLRDSDPNLKFKPHYKISGQSGYSVQIGPDVVVIGSKIPYPRWKNFSSKIYDVIEIFFNLEIIDSVNRLGIRYINFFEQDIFKEIDFKMAIHNDELIPKNALLRVEIHKNDFMNTLQIANNSSIVKEGGMQTGSIIDLDTFRIYEDENFKRSYREEIEMGHETEKQIFFNLLKPEFLKTLKPIY